MSFNTWIRQSRCQGGISEELRLQMTASSTGHFSRAWNMNTALWGGGEIPVLQQRVIRIDGKTTQEQLRSVTLQCGAACSQVTQKWIYFARRLHIRFSRQTGRNSKGHLGHVEGMRVVVGMRAQPSGLRTETNGACVEDQTRKCLFLETETCM
jgi:hypothetical protein